MPTIALQVYHMTHTDVIHGYAQEVETSHDARHHRDTPSSFSGLMGAGKNECCCSDKRNILQVLVPGTTQCTSGLYYYYSL